jgi:polysaccharide export outer membrane protein
MAMAQDVTGAVQAADEFTSSSRPGDTAYKIGPLDVLEVSVFQVPELSKSVQVAATGTVNLPLVNEIPVSGKTAQQVERDLTAKLGAKYLQKPQVTVYVKEYNSQRVTVEGAVKKPGVYPIRSKSSLLQFIAMAEGLDAAADQTVVIFRQTDGRRSVARFDISDIRAGKREDPTVQSGDVIVAGSSAMKEAFNVFIKLLPAAGAFAWL